MNLSLFTNAQLEAALERYAAEFVTEADAGRLASATLSHDVAQRIRAELEERAA